MTIIFQCSNKVGSDSGLGHLLINSNKLGLFNIDMVARFKSSILILKKDKYVSIPRYVFTIIQLITAYSYSVQVKKGWSITLISIYRNGSFSGRVFQLVQVRIIITLWLTFIDVNDVWMLNWWHDLNLSSYSNEISFCFNFGLFDCFDCNLKWNQERFRFRHATTCLNKIL